MNSIIFQNNHGITKIIKHLILKYWEFTSNSDCTTIDWWKLAWSNNHIHDYNIAEIQSD